MQQAEAGSMLTVFTSADQLNAYLNDDIVLAANNAPELCVLSGNTDAIETVTGQLKSAGIFCKPLQTSHAFHSPTMQQAADNFLPLFNNITLSAPSLPVISNVSGQWLTDQQACSPQYWCEHLLSTVEFNQGCQTLIKHFQSPDQDKNEALLFLEIGPQQALTTLTRQHNTEGLFAIASTTNVKQNKEPEESLSLLQAVGELWEQGAKIHWQALHDTPKQRVHLPTYPFESKPFWIEAGDQSSLTSADKTSTNTAETTTLHSELAQWFYRPVWQRDALITRKWSAPERHRWLIFDEANGLGEALFERFERQGEEAQRIIRRDSFTQSAYRCFGIEANTKADYQQLFAELKNREFTPSHILYLWPLNQSAEQTLQQAMQLQLLINQLGKINEPVQITLVTNQSYDVVGTETIKAHHAMLQGLCQVINQEQPLLACRQIDMDVTLSADDQLALSSAQKLFISEHLSREAHSENPAAVVAYRGKHRWQQQTVSTPISENCLINGAKKIIPGGHYLIFGDLDKGLGKIWAQYLAEKFQAKLSLAYCANEESSALNDQQLAALRQQTTSVNQRVIDTKHTETFTKSIDAIIQQQGSFDGVFFSTPMTNLNSAAPIAMLEESHWSYNQRTKIQPLQLLATALAKYPPSFYCVQSSLSSVVGGLGLAAYAGANHVLDSFVAQQNINSETPWYSINWDACRDAVPTQTNSEQQQDSAGWGSANENEFTLSGEEVWQATERVLQQGHSGQTIVSRGDLAQRVQQWIHFSPRVSVETVGDSGRHARPDLSTAFIAPRNEVETAVAEILQDLLGIEAIGVEDNFYDLGGHSLLAIQAIARLRETFPVDVEMRELLFESPTAERIAAVISEQLPGQDELAEMEALLQEIQQMDTA